MALFSERNGYLKVTDAITREDFPDQLRIRVWNVLTLLVWDNRWKYASSEEYRQLDSLTRRLWLNHFNFDYDRLPNLIPTYNREQTAYDHFKKEFLGAVWYRAFDFLEALLAAPESGLADKAFIFNNLFERERSAYRVVDGQIVEITSKDEISAIESALHHAGAAARSHLQRALELLSDRENPDFRNSVKESLSAVEAMCREATGTPAATLGAALKKVPHVHPSLGKAFGALYGYGSDESGVRHALTDKGEMCTYAEAKFMLVACSAFVSYLVDSTK